MYLIDDGTIRKPELPDTFHIKTLNTKKNNFSSCLAYDIDESKVFVLPYCEKDTDMNKWVVSYKGKENNMVNSKYISIHPKLNPELCLINYYNELGVNKNELVKYEKNKRYWKYSTVIADELPNKVKI